MSKVLDLCVLRHRYASAAAHLAVAAAILSPATAHSQPPAAPLVSYVRTDHGKSFVMAHGQPYLMYGVQMRLDHVIGDAYPTIQATSTALSTKQRAIIAQYFAHARSVGFHTVIVPVRWSYLEAAEGKYDFSYLDMIIDNAKANNLDVQILWYGSDVCGWNLVPPYVTHDRVRFPRNATYDTFFDLSSPHLIEREKTVVSVMMAHIASYDTTKRVMMVQVENEPDGVGSLTSGLKWGDAADMKAKMFAGDQFPAVIALMDILGKTVHRSPRSVVTRCNVGTNYRALDTYNARPAANPGVDIYGVDTYSLDPAAVKKSITILPESGGSVRHQPEGGGKSGNLVNLILSDFEEGGGSLIYELRGLEGDNGIYRQPANDDDWTERDGTVLLWNKQPENKTSQIRAFNSLIYKADKEIAVTAKGDCAAFNVDNHPGKWTETRTVGSISLTYQTADGSPAFALRDTHGTLVLMSLSDGSLFTVDPAYVHDATASVGYFDAANKWREQSRRLFTGHTLLMRQGEVIRILPSATASPK